MSGSIRPATAVPDTYTSKDSKCDWCGALVGDDCESGCVGPRTPVELPDTFIPYRGEMAVTAGDE